jgi:hypothetical protein
MKSQAILVQSTYSRTVTRLYITPSHQADVMIAQLESSQITWSRIRIKDLLFIMYHTPQHDTAFTRHHEGAFRINGEMYVGNAVLVPLGKDATELCINQRECNRVISIIEKELFFLKKEWCWFPDDMEAELDWSWVVKPSKKEMASHV